MNSCSPSLNEAYRCLQSGVPSNISPHVLATIMSSSFLCEPYKQRREQIAMTPTDLPTAPVEDHDMLICVALSLTEKMGSKLISPNVTQEDSLYFRDVYRISSHEFGLMSKLIHLFQANDRLVSHLAAKCASACVSLEIHSSEYCNAVNPVWEGKLLRAFENPSPGPELDACLWSLTAVIKTALRGSHGRTETLEKLLAAFGPSLSAVCSRLLPGGSVESDPPDCAVCVDNNTAAQGATLCTLLDLLEVVTATRVGCRLSYAQAPGLLRTVDARLDYFVKRRAVLLLKRILLREAGEDMALGGGGGSADVAGDNGVRPDARTLAEDVLRAVLRADWLRRVPVESAAVFFGGTSRSCDGGGSDGPDYVMLRAVSLVVLKSLEYKVQSGSGTGVGGTCAVVPVCMRSLLSFLRRSGTQLGESAHACTWVSLVLGEQDDDMMEAAKALLALQRHHGASSGTDADAASCAAGLNPHCHFLSLLRSVSFDHSVLLDFLISAETCFLEYFVRYLKHLRADWDGFARACQRTETPPDYRRRPDGGRGEPPPKPSPVPCVRVSSGGRLGGPGTGPDPVRAPAVRLVEYDGSSDESEPEQMVDVSGGGATEMERRGLDARLRLGGDLDLLQGMETGCTHQEPGSSQSSRSSQTTSDGRQSGTGGESQPRTDTSSRQRRLGPQSPKGQRLGASGGPSRDSRHGDRLSHADDTRRRAVACLSELRAVLSRLHRRNLFPYNPTCLLKLLAHVETKSGSQH